MSDTVTVIKRLPKNEREEIVVSLSVFKGKDLVDVRIFMPPAADESGSGSRPTQKGVAARVTTLPELIAALRDCETEAIRRGLLPSDDKAA